MNEKIALIEDNEDTRNLLESFFEMRGYIINSFKCADEFLEYIADIGYVDCDLIITDIFMEGTSGIEMINFLCEKDVLKDIPVIFISGMDDEIKILEAYEKANHSLTVDYIIKPFNILFLDIKIKNFLNLKQYHTSLLDANRDISQINLELNDILKEKTSVNDYLKERLLKIINKSDTKIKSQLDVVRKLLPTLATNDLGLLKFVLKIVENSRHVIEETILGGVTEEEEVFKILPKTIEPLKTAIVDFELAIISFVNMGIIDVSSVSNLNIEKTSFYEILSKMYSDGDFSAELFKSFIEDAKFNFKGGEIELF
ncbi:MAG: hypothetical protein A2086_07915 [Spirochaetes bacterium GWD1_27_9]|nr:MAG: hypothetical protein A2Z98_02910 [Spirochaetes bacterium GWB1_27_13]OHD46103.1 MAG: hypothetical protein A2086_07915 [Spirochaetes bacterium GWD1_27_9]